MEMLAPRLFLDGVWAVRPGRRPPAPPPKPESVQPKPAPAPKKINVILTPQTDPNATADVVHRNLEHIASQEGPANDAFIPSRREIAEEITRAKPKPRPQPSPNQPNIRTEPVQTAPVPPELLQSGTTVDRRIVKENSEAWDKAVEELRRQELEEGDPWTTFEEGWMRHHPLRFLVGDDDDSVGYAEVKNKKAYVAGTAIGIAGELAGGWLLGEGLGNLASSLLFRVPASRITTLSRVFSFGSRHPKIYGAVRGALKGAFVGGEAAKGITSIEAGEHPFDAVSDVLGDFAFWGGVGKGLSRSDPRIDVRGRKFYEGMKVQVDFYKGNEPEKSVVLLARRTQTGVAKGVGIHTREGSMITVTEKGARDLTMLWEESPGSRPPSKVFWREGSKFAVNAMGGPKRFFLYDPPLTREVDITIPEFRTYLRELRPLPTRGAKSFLEPLAFATGALSGGGQKNRSKNKSVRPARSRPSAQETGRQKHAIEPTKTITFEAPSMRPERISPPAPLQLPGEPKVEQRQKIREEQGEKTREEIEQKIREVIEQIKEEASKTPSRFKNSFYSKKL
jgi:hypothetical protein